VEVRRHTERETGALRLMGRRRRPRAAGRAHTHTRPAAGSPPSWDAAKDPLDSAFRGNRTHAVCCLPANHPPRTRDTHCGRTAQNLPDAHSVWRCSVKKSAAYGGSDDKFGGSPLGKQAAEGGEAPVSPYGQCFG
jgi:hypothetical protein